MILCVCCVCVWKFFLDQKILHTKSVQLCLCSGRRSSLHTGQQSWHGQAPCGRRTILHPSLFSNRINKQRRKPWYAHVDFLTTKSSGFAGTIHAPVRGSGQTVRCPMMGGRSSPLHFSSERQKPLAVKRRCRQWLTAHRSIRIDQITFINYRIACSCFRDSNIYTYYMRPLLMYMYMGKIS